jgi:hypothetical protein
MYISLSATEDDISNAASALQRVQTVYIAQLLICCRYIDMRYVCDSGLACLNGAASVTVLGSQLSAMTTTLRKQQAAICLRKQQAAICLLQ